MFQSMGKIDCDSVITMDHYIAIKKEDAYWNVWLWNNSQESKPSQI